MGATVTLHGVDSGACGVHAVGLSGLDVSSLLMTSPT